MCDGPLSCLVSTPYSDADRNIKIVMGVSIAEITGVSILLAVILIYLLRWKMKAKKQEEGDLGSDTSRRMK